MGPEASSRACGGVILPVSVDDGASSRCSTVNIAVPLDSFQLSCLLTQVPADKAAANGPHRIMAQALMKRAIGDIPIVTHIQKEANGMNKLYSQSMCSVKQWRAYQAAEAMVSAEVDEVREEADEIEPGWSQVSIQ